jgi:diguanylate cyclase (GGDEF)-like protein
VVWGDIPKAVRDGINEGRIRTRSLALGEGVAGLAAQQSRPMRLNHRSKIEQFSTNPVHCIMAVPLTYGGRLLGVINLTNKVDANGNEDPVGRYTEQDEHLAMGLADQAAHNLHKARLYDASITDRLTGLKNNRHFQEQLERAMARCRRDATGLCLAIVDIDHFKKFNDTYGHKVGDFVLMQTARILESSCRSSGADQAFRYGGEEFCMLLTETDMQTAHERMDAFREAVENAAHVWQNERLSVTCSVGICHFPSGAKNTSDLFEFADSALYAAKQSGRNRVCEYDSAAAKSEPYVGGAREGGAARPLPESGPIGSGDDVITLSPGALARLAASARMGSAAPSMPPELDAFSEGETGTLSGHGTPNLLVVDEDDPLAAMMG